MSEIAIRIGEKIREIRTMRNLSQEELAHRADMHPAHLGQLERGEKNPTVESLQKIINALDITFQELFDFDVKAKYIDEGYTEKIVAYLKAMTIEEQKDVYKTVKLLMKWKTKSKHKD